MKLELLSLAMMIPTIIGFNSCKADQNTQTNDTNNKSVVVYYSQTGNTEVIANYIKDLTGADIFRLEVVEAYPDDYHTLTEIAKKELNAGTKPKVKAMPDMTKYDIIYVGSPCWWATMAPPVHTFLTSFDFSGKTIVPFMTHEGSGMGKTDSDIKKYCPKANILKSLPIYGSSVKNAKSDIDNWLKSIKMK